MGGVAGCGFAVVGGVAGCGFVAAGRGLVALSQASLSQPSPTQVRLKTAMANDYPNDYPDDHPADDCPLPPDHEVELPMFPLGSVLLPQQELSLHVFEPRYLELLETCLAADRLFGVVLISRGSEVGGGDERTNVGTVARIDQVRPLPGGRQAVLAHGLSRLRVLTWLMDDPYPKAQVVAWPCEPERLAAAELASRFDAAEQLARRVWALRREMGSNEPEIPEDYPQDSPGSFSLANQVPLQPYDRQQLLTAPTVSARLERLTEFLAGQEAMLLANLN